MKDKDYRLQTKSKYGKEESEFFKKITRLFSGPIANYQRQYPYKPKKKDIYKYNFKDKDGDLITIEFQKIEDSLLPERSVLLNKNGYNVVYKVNGVLTQFKKTPINELLIILKTLVTIFNNFLKEIKPDFLFIKGTSKSSDDVEDWDTKDKMYYAIIKKNTPIDYGFEIQNMWGYKGSLLKNKIKFK